jgi:antitoxin ParD1/3/4
MRIGAENMPTPSEFIRQVLREKKERLEAARIRDAVIQGYQDAIAGRTVIYRGNLRRLLKKAPD